MANEFSFWAIFANGSNTPVKPMWTKEEAEIEAQALSEKTGARVYVLESIGSLHVAKNDVTLQR